MYVHHADVHAYIYSYQHVEEIQNFFFLLKNCREDLRLQEEFDEKLHHRGYSTVTIPSILRRKRIMNPIGNSLTHSLTHSGREHQIT
jgi:hypothetical protein